MWSEQGWCHPLSCSKRAWWRPLSCFIIITRGHVDFLDVSLVNQRYSQGYPPNWWWGSYEQADCESTIFSVAHRGTHRIDDEDPMNRLMPSKLQARWGKFVQESIYVNYCRACDDGAPRKNDGSRSLFNVDEGKFLPPPSTRWWGSRRVL